jgi:hypothetical protein
MIALDPEFYHCPRLKEEVIVIVAREVAPYPGGAAMEVLHACSRSHVCPPEPALQASAFVADAFATCPYRGQPRKGPQRAAKRAMGAPASSALSDRN